MATWSALEPDAASPFDPPVPPVGTLHRARLDALLDRGSALTVLRGPIGFGKTTAVADWLAGEHLRAAWVRPPRDCDRDTFWHLAWRALRHHWPELADWADPGAEPLERIRATVDLLPVRPVLVLDGLERLVGRTVEEELVDLARTAPALRLVVCVRTRRPFDEADEAPSALVVAGQELEFTPAETREVFAAAGLEVPQSALEPIQRRTGGWPGATVAAADAARPASRPRATTAELLALAEIGAERFLNERMLPELEDYDHLDLLLELAVPQDITARGLQALAPALDSDHALARLETDGVVDPDDTLTPTHYHYPGAVRATLRRELPERDQTRILELHRMLSGFFAGRQRIEEAVDHSLKAHDWAGTVDLLDGHWDELLHDHLAVLRRALAGLPAPLAARYPAV